MVAAAILKKKIEKILIPSQPLTDFDEILHTNASRPSPPKWPIKFPNFKTPNILKIWKISNISATDPPILTKFGMLVRLDPLARRRYLRYASSFAFDSEHYLFGLGTLKL